MQIEIDGKLYTVKHSFGPTRVIVDYDGLFVFADKLPGGVWELSGEPARENEKPILKALTDPMNDNTDLKIIKD